ncbi:MAG: NADH-quinone oxidoreductase subunit A [Bradymonadaceae bacterium]
MILDQFAVVGLVGLATLGLVLLGAALGHSPAATIEAPDAWKKYRFGFAVYTLMFVAFDMEMIFMYPWAVVFAEEGMKAFFDMFVFIGLLSAGIAYAWGMGGMQWE